MSVSRLFVRAPVRLSGLSIRAVAPASPHRFWKHAMNPCARLLLLAATLFLFAVPPYARAEQDYQFGQALMNEGYFDLTERFLLPMLKSRDKKQRVIALKALGTLKKRLALDG